MIATNAERKKDQSERISRNTSYENGIADLETKIAEKRTLIDSLHREIQKQEQRIKPAEEKFANTELLGLMIPPRATAHQVNQARDEMQKILKEVELSVKKNRAAIWQTSEEVEVLEKEVATTREKYRQTRINALNEAFFANLSKQAEALETLLECGRKHFQMAQECQQVLIRFAASWIYADGNKDREIEGFLRNTREILQNKLGARDI